MQVLANRSGKILAAYIPHVTTDAGSPQVTLAANERRSLYEVEVPSELDQAGLTGATLRSYRVRTEGSRAKLVLVKPIKRG